MTPAPKEAALHALPVDPAVHDVSTGPGVQPGGFSAIPPSHEVAPTKVHTVPQQGSTQPGDGATVHAEGEMYASDTSASSQPTTQTTDKVPFKEQVIGYAQKTRGTLLGKTVLKEHGERILEGQTTHAQDRERN